MIDPRCGMCDNELTEPGGLLIGAPPPRPIISTANLVRKTHLCVDCTRLIESVVAGRNVVVSRQVPQAT